MICTTILHRSKSLTFSSQTFLWCSRIVTSSAVVHIINQPKIFQVVCAMFKPFLREKLKNRIIFHGTDRASLHKHIAPKCLPPNYGGTFEEPRVNGDQWYELLLKCQPEYEAINSYGYNRNGSTKKK